MESLENSEINDKWLKNMKEIYKRYEKFDETPTSSIICIIFFIRKTNEITEIIKKKINLSNNSINYEEINNVIHDYSGNNYRILDVFQSYVPYNHEEIEQNKYSKNPLIMKNVTDKDIIYYPSTTNYMKKLNNLTIFCKENTSMCQYTKKIRIKNDKKTHKNRKFLLNNFIK